MQNRSTFTALALSATAAIAIVAVIMPPSAIASASVMRCGGYERLNVLLRDANAAEAFSMLNCVAAVRRF